MGARPTAGARDTGVDIQTYFCNYEELRVRETGFNNSHYHLNTTVVNRTRGTHGGLRGMTWLIWSGAQGERGWTRQREQNSGTQEGWKAIGGKE